MKLLFKVKFSNISISSNFTNPYKNKRLILTDFVYPFHYWACAGNNESVFLWLYRRLMARRFGGMP